MIYLIIILIFTIILYIFTFKKDAAPPASLKFGRFLVSAEPGAYQDWQVVAAYYSAKINSPNVDFIYLASTNNIAGAGINPKLQHIPHMLVSNWTVHNNDHYPPYNRPKGICEYIRTDPIEKWVIIVDPDVIICRDFAEIIPKDGEPIAQYYYYLKDEINGHKIDKVGMPIFITSTDLKKLAPLWLKWTEIMRNKSDEWIAEMYGYCLAAAELGFKHSVRNDLADRVPYNTVKNPYLLHYDLPFLDGDSWMWDKRDYIDKDILKTGELMPTNTDNKQHAFILETINTAVKNLSQK